MPYGNKACERFFYMSQMVLLCLRADAHAQAREDEQIGRAPVSQFGLHSGIHPLYLPRDVWTALAESACGVFP